MERWLTLKRQKIRQCNIWWGLSLLSDPYLELLCPIVSCFCIEHHFCSFPPSASWCHALSRLPESGRALGSRDQYGSIAREGALITGPRAQEKTEENRSLQLLGQQQSADRKKKDAQSAWCIKCTLRERCTKIIQQLWSKPRHSPYSPSECFYLFTQ